MSQPKARYRLEPETSSFIIENYNWGESFSNFFPGIAGKWGIPLWCYYINRGQAVASMGVGNKDGQILEFYSFNKAVMRVAREGFRTFIRADGGPVYEPFRKTRQRGVRQLMRISPAELMIRETNDRLGLEIEVRYFPLPNLPIAALARDVRIRNLRRKSRRLEWIDGAPRILPFGLNQGSIKFTSRHIEAMMGVDMFHGFPVFRLKQTAADTERIDKITDGHFYAPLGSARDRGIVVDPAVLFGETLNFDHPWSFEEEGARGVLARTQIRENKTPAAFAVRSERLAGREETRQVSFLGHVRRDEDLLPFLTALKRKSFISRKRRENTRIAGAVAHHCFTASAAPAFDAYCGQDFLDNVIRGGMPLMFDTAAGPSAFYLYSRQNGGLERDYHQFVLDATYLSQGNGHYRSVLQNRRTDTWFFPQVEDANIRTFMNLIQLDGYNPLEVRCAAYRVADEKGMRLWLRRRVRSRRTREAMQELIRRPFSPGEFLRRLEHSGGGAWNARSGARRERIIREALTFCVEDELGGLHEGFWVDHWHYNFDLLENYLMVYPDRLRRLLLERRDYTFFDDPDIILPRAKKSVDAGGRIRSYGAVVRDPDKQKMIAARISLPYTVRTRGGRGRIYRTHLLAKLLCIVVNRLATLDASGTGVEKEAGKPGWNDSMNGLPGLFGSGLSEAMELRRAVRFLHDAISDPKLADGGRVTLYGELASFIRALRKIMRRRTASRAKIADFRYWDESNSLKERYRERTKFGVTGSETKISPAELKGFLADAQELLDTLCRGPRRRRFLNRDGVPYTYFVNKVTRHRLTGGRSHLDLPLVEPRAFRQRPVRLFLEGPVHWMKARRSDAKAVYSAVRRSGIYDRKLKMYKSCEDMRGESHELGRAVGAYPRGWIENESVYLHMEYKYLLEILRAGLCREFWSDAKTCLIPFMDPAVYKRSTLEGASFLVSSAYVDPRLHGRAFQPRLSGLTCEFLHMWILAVAGERPFRTGEDGGLELAFEPRLPDWLFTKEASTRPYTDPQDGWTELAVPKNAFAFKFLGHTAIVYHNEKRRSTYGPRAARPGSYRCLLRSGRVEEVVGDCLRGELAAAVRRGEVRRIDAYLE
ncbi:MAG: hypothetical protein ABIJ96_12680 [Elusimicrobiota bacterium]